MAIGTHCGQQVRFPAIGRLIFGWKLMETASSGDNKSLGTPLHRRFKGCGMPECRQSSQYHHRRVPLPRTASQGRRNHVRADSHRRRPADSTRSVQTDHADTHGADQPWNSLTCLRGGNESFTDHGSGLDAPQWESSTLMPPCSTSRYFGQPLIPLRSC